MVPPAASSTLTFAQDQFDVLFIEGQAAIKEVVFKKYKSGKMILLNGFLLGDNNLIFQKESLTADKAVFVHRDKDKEIIKRFIFPKTNYTIELEIEIRNLSNLNLDLNLPLVLGTLNFVVDPNEARFQDLAIITKDKAAYLNGRKNSVIESIQFLGLRNRYFCAIIEPEKGVYSGIINQLDKQESQAYLQAKEPLLAPGQKILQKFRIYLGPQDLPIINSIKPEWSVVMHYGTFNFIAHILLQLLEFLYKLVHNWGWVLVILSILIYAILFPLSLKQMRSMKAMQTIQPRVEELRRTYKDNPQRLNKEIMALYKEHKVNPFGGCLPLLLQIPVFFALYQVLMRSVALKGANFLWIKDLSEPDRLLMLPVSLPAIGNEFNILPIVMAAEMFVQQKISMSTATGGSAEQQKIMLIVFPIMFGLIFYKMPSGLVLYWFINSSLMLAYQLRMSRQK